MLKIVIDAENSPQLKPWEGEYPIDFNLDHDEAHLVKQMAGVRMGELVEAVGAVDADVIGALGVIACERAGKPLPPDRLKKAKFGSIQFKVEVDPEDEPDPLDQTTDSPPKSENENDSEPDPKS